MAANPLLENSHAEALLISERLSIAAEATGLGVWDWNLLTGAVSYSERAKTIFGFPPNSSVSFDMVRRATHPDDLPVVEAASRRALDPDIREKKAFEYRIVKPDGSIRWAVAHCEAVFDKVDGKVRAVRQVGTLQDITDRKLAAQALHDSEESLRATQGALAETVDRLRLATEGTDLGTYDLDLELDEGVWSAATFEMLGLPVPHDCRGSSTMWRSQVVREDEERLRQEYECAAAAGGHWRTQYRIRRADNQEVRWLSIYGQFVHEGGIPKRSVGIVLDVTEQKRAEERQALLINELNHRVKNTLAIVQSIAAQTFRGEQVLEGRRRAFESRLMALSAVHNLLTRESWEGAELGAIVRESIAPHDRGDGRIIADGPKVSIDPALAVSVALALHELCTNALKYGSLSQDEGRVFLRWSVEQGEGRTLKIEWREEGGPDVAPPTRHGFGSRMIERGLFPDVEGGARLHFDTEGLRCSIATTLPISCLQR